MLGVVGWLFLSLCLFPVAFSNEIAGVESAAKWRHGAVAADMRLNEKVRAAATSALRLLSANDLSVKLVAGRAHAAAQESQAKRVKRPSIVEMLEGHENELIIGGAIAAAFFILGWICGGNYYLRRERRQRNRIRF
jgi:hypothetical protein